jgi:hypothetical protein
MAEFRTSSITKAAYIEISCVVTADIRRAPVTREIVFVFSDSLDIIRAADLYHNGGTVPARDFAKAIGSIRAKCREMGLYCRLNG